MVRDMSHGPLEGEASQLQTPPRLFSRVGVLTRPSPIPAVVGVYAWCFDEVPGDVPVDGCRAVDGHTLLYVRISPKKPGADGLKPSQQCMRIGTCRRLLVVRLAPARRPSLGARVATSTGACAGSDTARARCCDTGPRTSPGRSSGSTARR